MLRCSGFAPTFQGDRRLSLIPKATLSQFQAYSSAEVPQGSVLGSLLFALYLSDFKEVLKHRSYNLYADDLMIYLHCDAVDIDNDITKLNADITSICSWVTKII